MKPSVPVALLLLPALAFCAGTDTAAPKPLTEWYYPHGLLMPKGTKPETAVHGVTAKSTEWLAIANLGAAPSTAVVTYYFEEDPPVRRVRQLAPHASCVFETGKVPNEDFPRGKLYGVRVVAESPVLVQATQAETEEVKPGEMPGNSNMSFVAYPGPLGRKETKWVYGDGHAIHNEGKKGWSDHEWITILNPNPGKDAHIRITFNYAAEQVAHALTVPAERVRTIDLYELLSSNKGFYPVVASDVPVVVEQIRRPVRVENPAPRGGWAALAFPIGDLDIAVPEKLPSQP